MTSLLEGDRDHLPPPGSGGSGTGQRVEALATAAGLARHRAEDRAVDEAEDTATRAAGRMRLSADHTVVAIAGATGSGKSSTFNALTGLDLSAVGVRRPTTSWATACVWGSGDATGVLDWLGIPPRHQTSRDSMLDRSREESADLDGVVLLDLPDHDSTEVSHHLEVDRLIEMTDLMVWVLDPQKYADAAVHDRYLAPLAAHADSMVVVLNHLDVVPEARRESMLDDVRRLLALDGLETVPVIGVSAREGWGVDELRSQVARRVTDKGSARGRVDTDVRAAAERLADASGVGAADVAPRELSDRRAASFVDALAEASGVPVVVDAVTVVSRRRAARATGWPPVSWLAGLRADPLRRAGVELGESDREVARELGGRGRSALPETTTVQRARTVAAVRAVADETSDGLPSAWQQAVRRASTDRSEELAGRLDAVLTGTDLAAAKLPPWVHAVRVVQWLLLAAAVVGGVWLALSAAGAVEDVVPGGIPGGFPLSLVLLVGGLVAGLLLALVCRALVGSTARTRAAVADLRLRKAIGEVADEVVVGPVRGELSAHAELAAALARART